MDRLDEIRRKVNHTADELWLISMIDDLRAELWKVLMEMAASTKEAGDAENRNMVV